MRVSSRSWISFEWIEICVSFRFDVFGEVWQCVRGCYFSSNKCEIGFLTRDDEMA